MDAEVKNIGVTPNRRIVVRRYGNYVCELENTQGAVKDFLLKNMAPTEDTPTDNTGCRISEYIGFITLIRAAKRANFTFELIKTPTK